MFKPNHLSPLLPWLLLNICMSSLEVEFYSQLWADWLEPKNIVYAPHPLDISQCTPIEMGEGLCYLAGRFYRIKLRQ